MDLYHFESASTKEVKPVSTTEEQWLKLKEWMAQAQTVDHWNDLRDEAKKLYPMSLIYRLDTSGYIIEVFPNSERV